MPKSHGRRPHHGGKKPVRRSPRPLRSSDLMLRDARRITGLADPLRAEAWASDWLGQAWLNAPLGEREAEHLLCMEVCLRREALLVRVEVRDLRRWLVAAGWCS